MNRKIKRNIVTLSSFFVLILMFCVKATGVHVHMILGLAFIIALGIHTFKRWGRLLKCPIRFNIADVGAAAAMLSAAISAFLIPFFKGSMVMLIIHMLAAVVLVAGSVVHIVLHYPKKKK